ncbi:MAG: hypothetical protein ACYCPS_04845 [Candidatus Saccharimonadales bacterium]
MRDGLTDEVMINANLVENDPSSTAAALQETNLPVTIDPVLYRFQRPEWWRNDKGEPKRNYRRLAEAYTKGTNLNLLSGPLVGTIKDERAWRTLAGNAIGYQRSRLQAIPTQLDLFATVEPRVLRPVRFTAPAFVAHTRTEDSINRVLAEASIEASPERVAVPVIVPPERLKDDAELDALLRSVPSDGVGLYLIWTPDVSEERLLSEPTLLPAVLRLVVSLAERGPVGHLHGGYVLAALHELGLAAIAHTLSWTDSGEPAVREGGGGPRSCRTYVPGVRYCLPFSRAHRLGRPLGRDDYVNRYCDCAFCVGAFENEAHPLDLLLEEQEIRVGRGWRHTPTQAAIKLNTWHYAFARRGEQQAFSTESARDVILRDMERAQLLADQDGAERLRRIAGRLRTA